MECFPRHYEKKKDKTCPVRGGEKGEVPLGGGSRVYDAQALAWILRTQK